MAEINIEPCRLAMAYAEHDRLLRRSERPGDWRDLTAGGMYDALVMLGVQRYKVGPELPQ